MATIGESPLDLVAFTFIDLRGCYFAACIVDIDSCNTNK